MKLLAITAASTSLVMMAGCAAIGNKTASTSEDSKSEVQSVATTPVQNTLRPSLTAPPEIIKRMKFDPNREIRVTGDQAIYSGTAASRVQMANLPDPATVTSVPAESDNVRVSGGAQIESPWSDEEVAAAIAAATENAPNKGMQKLRSGSRGNSGPKVKSSFDAIGAENCCNDPVPFTATVPPDPDIAVGPNHVIVVVNVSFAIYDKNGNELMSPTPFSTFFAGVDPACDPGGPFDPDVVFDESTGQFILGVDGNGTDYCIAMTTDGDPMGDWNRFAFPADINGEFFDFPHMGVGVDAVYVGSNQFGAGFVGGRVFAVNKDDLMSGDPLRVVQRLVPNFNSTPQPAQLHGVSRGTYPTEGPDYIMTEFFDGINHSVWAWNDPFGADEFVLLGDVDLATASGVPCDAGSCFPVPVIQQGSTVLLAGNDWRGQETEYRDGKLWTAQTVSCDPGTGVVNCVRWAQIDPAAVTPGSSTDGVLNAGVFSAEDGNSRWFPSLAVDACGNMAIGYSISGPSIFPSVAVTGRKFNDRYGEVRNEVVTVNGNEPYRSFQNPAAPNRWGDYSGMTIDPDGGRFWYVGEYAGQTDNPFANWRTYVSEHQLGCGGNY